MAREHAIWRFGMRRSMQFGRNCSSEPLSKRERVARSTRTCAECWSLVLVPGREWPRDWNWRSPTGLDAVTRA